MAMGMAAIPCSGNGVLVATGGNYGSSEQTVFNCPRFQLLRSLGG